MAEKTTQTIAIDAEPGKVMAVIADIGAYPEWVSEYKETEVLDTDAEGRVKRARLVLDAGVLKDTQVLEYVWSPDGRKVTWTTADTETTPATGSRIAERFITREDCTILIGARCWMGCAVGWFAGAGVGVGASVRTGSPSSSRRRRLGSSVRRR